MKYTDKELQIIESIENGKPKTVPYDNVKMNRWQETVWIYQYKILTAKYIL